MEFGESVGPGAAAFREQYAKGFLKTQFKG